MLAMPSVAMGRYGHGVAANRYGCSLAVNFRFRIRATKRNVSCANPKRLLRESEEHLVVFFIMMSVVRTFGADPSLD